MEDIRGPRQSNGSFRFVAIILVILVIAAIGYGLFRWLGNGSMGGNSSDGYEAVFLTNGQVYFSKVEDRNKQFLTLSDIYYLVSSKIFSRQEAISSRISHLFLWLSLATNCTARKM